MMKRKKFALVLSGLLATASLSSCMVIGEGYLSSSDYETKSEKKDGICSAFFYLGGELILEETVPYGSMIDPPKDELIPEGYTVNFWYSDQSSYYGEPWDFSSQKIVRDTKLFADYSGNTYTVLINKGDETFAAEVTYGSEYSFVSYFDERELQWVGDFIGSDGLYYKLSGSEWTAPYGLELTPNWRYDVSVGYSFLDLTKGVIAEVVDEKGNCIGYSLDGSFESLEEEIGNPNPSFIDRDWALSNDFLLEPYCAGYAFDGWYMESGADFLGAPLYTKDPSLFEVCVFSQAVVGVFHRTFFAYPNDSNWGYVSEATAGGVVTVTAVPNQGYRFDGWWNGDSLVSRKNPYTFTLFSSVCPLEARFVEDAPLVFSPVISQDGTTLTYGAYPQSRVWDESIISSLESLSGPTINDWYLLDGNYYARLSATPRSSKSKFDDGEKIVTGQEYWFRCEPIEWKILSSSGGEYSLVSSKLLDTAMFNDIYDGEQVDGHYANNYAFSSIRSWLNGDFLTTAFPYENEYLETVEVDNSAATTDSSENVYACENTFDQVYLLSYQDYANATYFPDDNSRRCQTSEWARAKGANVYTSSGLNHTNYYYTRSPYSANPDYALAIYPNGNFSYGSRTNYTQDSPRPGITIKIA